MLSTDTNNRYRLKIFLAHGENITTTVRDVGWFSEMNCWYAMRVNDTPLYFHAPFTIESIS